MESYGALAAYYDRLMAHVDYDAWTSYAVTALDLESWADFGRTVLDLACGTGSISVRLAARGMDVVGIDRSSDMLAAADVKAREWDVPLRLSLQDLTSFEWTDKADAAVCLFDSFNYLTSLNDLEKAFRRTAEALRAGAPFLFDIHTEARLCEIGSQTYGDVEDDVAYLWQSVYDDESRICEMQVTLFVADPRSGLFQRYDEVHYERAHAPDEVDRALAAAGFTLEATMGTDALDVGLPGEGRMFYLARRT